MFGWPTLVHCCSRCQSNTVVEYTATVWTQDHTCSHCGLNSPGADIEGRSEDKMDRRQHDELAQLFAQNMHLSQQQNIPRQETPQHNRGMVADNVPQQHLEKQAEPPIHYISAHYTPTAHIRPDTTSEPSRSPSPPYDSASMPQAMAEILIQHSIDPSALLPSQINLFYHADYAQRLRLLELWRISPPSYPLEEHIIGGWTTVEREEVQAKQRFEQMVQKVHLREGIVCDTHVPISPIREPGETAWPPAARMRVASITAASRSVVRNDEAEPYIVNGYQSDQAAKSTDPVYAAVNLWQAPQINHEHSTVADQYGMYEQVRNHADWERMNEQVARHSFVGFHGPMDSAMDDDMVM